MNQSLNTFVTKRKQTTEQKYKQYRSMTRGILDTYKVCLGVRVKGRTSLQKAFVTYT